MLTTHRSYLTWKLAKAKTHSKSRTVVGKKRDPYLYITLIWIIWSHKYPPLNAKLSLLCVTHILPCLWICCCYSKHPDGRLEVTRLNYDWVWHGITGVWCTHNIHNTPPMWNTMTEPIRPIFFPFFSPNSCSPKPFESGPDLSSHYGHLALLAIAHQADCL